MYGQQSSVTVRLVYYMSGMFTGRYSSLYDLPNK